jgi:hypothetical protein
VTASEIIDEIKRLAPEEQAGIVRFIYQLDAERKLSGPELSALAERLVNAKDPIEASRVRESIVRGFYGAIAEANFVSNSIMSKSMSTSKRAVFHSL